MKNPSTKIELVSAIETLIESYMDDLRDAAKGAVERALHRGASSGEKVRSGRDAALKPTTTGIANRRTPEEIDKASHALCELVRARPGASAAELAEQMGTPVVSLQRPMTKLKAAGHVRSVGLRHLTRYYPTVVRPAAGKD